MSILLSNSDESYFDDFITVLAISIEEDDEQKKFIKEASKFPKEFYQYCIHSGLDKYMSLVAIRHCPTIQERYSSADFITLYCKYGISGCTK